MRRVKVLWIRIIRKFRTDRFFRIKPPFKGPGWYFDTRDGEPWGPYSTLDEARLAAASFAQDREVRGETGGRDDSLLKEADLA
jgi:hypothetical protein